MSSRPLAQHHAGERLLTAEEFFDLYAGRDFELDQGRVVPMPPTSPEHGDIDSTLHLELGGHVKVHRLGRIYLNTGFILFRNPDVIRAPDQAFVSSEKLGRHPPPRTGFWAVAPDLAVEIVSPNDTADELAQKVSEYLGAGVGMVWIVYPKLRQVHQFRPGSDPKILSGGDSLDGMDVVHGFHISLAQLWPD